MTSSPLLSPLLFTTPALESWVMMLIMFNGFQAIMEVAPGRTCIARAENVAPRKPIASPLMMTTELDLKITISINDNVTVNNR